MPLISIIVPVCNVEPYIHRCIDSILNQTYTDFELILVDDGSPDNCGTICDVYAAKDNRITVIHQENVGLSAARNAGIDWSFAHSDSQWLSFIDSDDWVHPEYLNSLLNATTINNVDVSICNFYKSNGEIPEITSNSIISYLCSTEKFYIENSIVSTVAHGKLYKKSCFKHIRFPINRIYDDGFTTYKILFEYSKIAFISVPLYFYFVNPNGITHRKFSIRNYDGLLAREERIDYFIKNGHYNIYQSEENAYRFEKALFSIVSRKAQIYDLIPPKYKVGWITAMRTIRKNCTRDQYGWIMHEYHPLLVRFFAKLYKIKNLFRGAKTNE